MIINGTTGNDSLTGTSSDDTISGFAGNDTINALAGNDRLDGGAGTDSLNGGSGNDTYVVTAGDVLADSGGVDTVLTDVSWTLGAGFENLTMTGTGNISVTGNELGNFAIGNSGANYFNLRAGNDTIQAAAGNDWIDMSNFGTPSYGDDVIDGGAGFDTVSFTTGSGQRSAVVVDLAAGTARGGGEGGIGSATLTSIEWVIGAAFNDRLSGSGVAERFEGRAGNDTLSGLGGNDTLTGGTEQDTFVFASAPASGNVDLITDFVSATDKLSFDNAVFTGLGSAGNFSAGDARFAAGAGFTSGRDESDRIVYDTTTRNLYYDADGSGAGLSQLVATLPGTPTLVATDITVIGEGAPPPPPPPGAIQGTAGNDSLTGTEGNDSINGLGGSDTIDGRAGNDSLDGGAGNDSLVGSEGADFLIGGDGNDTLNGFYSESFGENEVDVDTMNGGSGDDWYYIDNANDVLSESDTVTGGIDTVVVFDLDWTLGAGFENLVIRDDVSEGGHTGIGNDLANVMSISYGGSRLEGRGGNDTLRGSGNSDALLGETGNDSLEGGFSHDRLDGGAGDDILIGGEDFDTLTGGAGADSFIFDTLPGDGAMGGANDRITDFASGVDRIRLDARVMRELGASGTLAAGDPRFYTAAGASSGHDADDRLVYDISSGRFYFDADGHGTEEARLIATLHSGTGAAALAETDITVDHGGVARTGTAGNDSLVGGSGNDSISGLAGNDTLVGLDGHDTLDGGAGVDQLEGGPGHDTYYVTNGDVVVETGGFTGGIDTVIANVSWTLSAGAENLQLLEGAVGAVEATGNADRNEIRGNSGNNVIRGGGEQDTLMGGAGNDTVIGEGFDHLYGDAGNDVLTAGSTGDLNGGEGHDRLEGGSWVWGDAGNDTIVSGAGNAEIIGGLGADTFIVAQPPGTANWDRYVDFTTGEDELRFDGQVFRELGASGDFTANDERFYAAPGASGAHDATDRLVYNTTTGELRYDPDGSGGQDSLSVATLRDWRFGAQPADLQATDIAVDNGTAPPGGQVINGTAGNDSLVGGAGNDSLAGLGGNDTLVGNAGNDSLDGGAGTDSLNGGLGNDTYIVTSGDVLSDSGGVDTVVSDVTWTLGAGFENLTMTGTAAINVTGNELGNFAIGNSAANYFNLRAGNDTIQAGGGNDWIDMSNFGTPSYGDDVIDGGAGFDTVSFTTGSGQWSAITVELFLGEIRGGGQAGAGSARVTAVERVIGTAFNDRFTGSSSADTFEGREGNDTFSGLDGNDTLTGGTGQDTFEFAGPLASNVDLVTDFVSATDKVAMENRVFIALGAEGNFVAGDARFAAGAGFTSGRDESDRVIYNTSTGSLYYDADGSASGASVLIATFTGNPAIAASDIVVI